MEMNERYAHELYYAITRLFDEENENYRFELNEIDGTEFFIGMVKASAILYNKITNDDKSLLEFTHLMNQLVVQNMMSNKNAS